MSIPVKAPGPSAVQRLRSSMLGYNNTDLSSALFYNDAATNLNAAFVNLNDVQKRLDNVANSEADTDAARAYHDLAREVRMRMRLMQRALRSAKVAVRKQFGFVREVRDDLR